MAWRGAKLYLNGEAFSPDAAGRRLLRRFADRHGLDAADLQAPDASAPVFGLLRQWHDAGWIRLGAAP